MEYSKDLSIIVPLLNEEESLPELLAWIRSVMNANGYEYEVLFIDDGSTDGSWCGRHDGRGPAGLPGRDP